MKQALTSTQSLVLANDDRQRNQVNGFILAPAFQLIFAVASTVSRVTWRKTQHVILFQAKSDSRKPEGEDRQRRIAQSIRSEDATKNKAQRLEEPEVTQREVGI